MIFAEGATDPESWGKAFGGLGPGGVLVVCLLFCLLFGLGALGAGALALVGIPRWRIPGLAWTIAGVWRELHGLRLDLRAFQAGDPLPDLDPLEDSVPPPPAPPRVAKPAQPVRGHAPIAPPSQRRRQDSRPK